jgi:transposase
MSTKYITIDRKTPMLLPPDLREWVPDDDMVHFVIEAVEGLPTKHFAANRRGTGSAQYPPQTLLALLIYCYANGLFSSRRIEAATYRDVGVRYLTANTHPDHSTICAFRQANAPAIHEAFLHVLKLAREMKLLKVGTISVDGTQITANASKYKNVSYDRAGELDKQLELDIAEILKKAEAADASDDAAGQQLPEELARREKLRAKMQEARARLERQARTRAKEERAAYEEKVARREARSGSAKGCHIKPPKDTPDGAEQINLTDPDSRIMRKNKRSEYRQAYNAQAAVDADGTHLILTTRVTNCASDANELLPMIESVSAAVGKPERALADSGYANSEAFEAMEKSHIDTYVAVSSDENHAQRRYEYRPEPHRSTKTITDPRLLDMRRKLQTEAGRKMYAKRKQTVEPVFGIIKSVLGFGQFLLRGLAKVAREWELVCLSYNVKRLFRLKTA